MFVERKGCMKLNKEDFARRLAENLNTTIGDSKWITDVFLETIVEAMEQGDTIMFSGFGKFYTVDKSPRRGLDLNKNEVIVPGFKAMLFKQGGNLKERLTNSMGELHEEDE